MKFEFDIVSAEVAMPTIQFAPCAVSSHSTHHLPVVRLVVDRTGSHPPTVEAIVKLPLLKVTPLDLSDGLKVPDVPEPPHKILESVGDGMGYTATVCMVRV
jgi:hypothetical protein